MSNVVNITGASFPNSGTATAANSGLDRVSEYNGASLEGFTYTEVTGSDVPPDAVLNASSKYMIMRATHNGVGPARFNISSESADATAMGTGGIYYSFWIRPRLLAALVSGDHRDTIRPVYCGLNGSSAKLSMEFTIIRAASVLNDWALDDGLGIVVQNSVTRPTSSTTTGWPQTFVNPTSSTYATPLMRFDQWMKLTVHFRKSATEGRMSIYLNDTLCYEAGNFDSSDSGETILTNWYDHDFELGYHEKIGWDVAGPFRMDNMTGGELGMLPRHDLVPANSSITQVHMHNAWLDGATSGISGTFFDYSQETGTPTIALTRYASSGDRPYSSRAVITGDATEVAQIESRDDLGTLPYRTMDGWATVCTQDILHNALTTVAGTLRNTADDGDLLTFSVDTSGNLSVNGADSGLDLSANTHYHMALHMNLSGACRVTLVDLGNDTLTSTHTYSAVCDDWTPGEIGKFRLTVTYLATASSVVVQFGTLMVCETWEICGVDSLTEVNTLGLTPVYSCPAHVSDSFAATRQNAYIPGGRWTRYNEWTAAGQGRRGIACVVGRSGGRQGIHFLAYTLPGLLETRGARLWLIDGFSVNDVAGFASITDADDAATYAASMNTDTESILAQWVGTQRNEAWLDTMHDRPDYTNWSGDAETFVDMRNAGIELAAKKYQSGARIQFSDTSSIEFTNGSTANLHPVDEENQENAVAMIENLTTPEDIGIYHGVRGASNTFHGRARKGSGIE